MNSRREEKNEVVEVDGPATPNDRALAFAANLGDVLEAVEKQGDNIKQHAIGALRDVVMGD